MATHCHKIADVSELNQDARELPVRQYYELIFQHFSIAFHLTQLPCHQLCYRPPDDRSDRRRSLIDRFEPNIQRYLVKKPLSNISVLAFLDFSSAFETIDHPIPVHRLHTDFGFTDAFLQWFSSYLTDRTHYVSI